MTVKKTVTKMSVISAADIKSKKSESFACFVLVKSTDYHLHDSYILNLIFNTHIYNDWSRIYDFQSVNEDDILYAEDSILTILDYKSVKITIQSSLDSFNITLCEVIFIFIFHINLITLNQLMNKEMHFESWNSRLKYNNDTFCWVKHEFDQWVLKYNELIASD